MPEIIWTSYLRYRVIQRGFDLDLIENILRFSSERYYDVETERAIVVGKHGEQLVVIPYEQSENTITPITIHGMINFLSAKVPNIETDVFAIDLHVPSLYIESVGLGLILIVFIAD